MKKIFLFIFLFIITNLSFASSNNGIFFQGRGENADFTYISLPDTAGEKDPIGIRLGFEFRTGDLLNSDGYPAEINTNFNYSTNFEKYNASWLSMMVGIGFNLTNLGPKTAISGGSVLEWDDVDAYFGFRFEVGNNLYAQTIFNFNDWIGFYFGWNYQFEKSFLDIYVYTEPNWNPYANEMDGVANFETIFGFSIAYRFILTEISQMELAFEYTIPYAKAWLEAGSPNFENLNKNVPVHRMEPKMTFFVAGIDLGFSLRIQYYTAPVLDYVAPVTLEPRISIGASF